MPNPAQLMMGQPQLGMHQAQLFQNAMIQNALLLSQQAGQGGGFSLFKELAAIQNQGTTDGNGTAAEGASGVQDEQTNASSHSSSGGMKNDIGGEQQLSAKQNRRGSCDVHTS